MNLVRLASRGLLEESKLTVVKCLRVSFIRTQSKGDRKRDTVVSTKETQRCRRFHSPILTETQTPQEKPNTCR
jgi:hypothetical protein